MLLPIRFVPDLKPANDPWEMTTVIPANATIMPARVRIGTCSPRSHTERSAIKIGAAPTRADA